MWLTPFITSVFLISDCIWKVLNKLVQWRHRCWRLSFQCWCKHIRSVASEESESTQGEKRWLG
jgi:hypothetical protein